MMYSRSKQRCIVFNESSHFACALVIRTRSIPHPHCSSSKVSCCASPLTHTHTHVHIRVMHMLRTAWRAKNLNSIDILTAFNSMSLHPLTVAKERNWKFHPVSISRNQYPLAVPSIPITSLYAFVCFLLLLGGGLGFGVSRTRDTSLIRHCSPGGNPYALILF